jgi:hypothetical protein
MKNQRRMHEAADRIQGRVAAAVVRGFEAARARVDLGALVGALSRRDALMANKIVRRADLEDALAPAGAILHDAMQRGGAIGAEEE